MLYRQYNVHAMKQRIFTAIVLYDEGNVNPNRFKTCHVFTIYLTIIQTRWHRVDIKNCTVSVLLNQKRFQCKVEHLKNSGKNSWQVHSLAVMSSCLAFLRATDDAAVAVTGLGRLTTNLSMSISNY